MKKITTIEDLQKATSFMSKMTYQTNLDTELDELPAYLKEIIISDLSILPRHISTELFEKLLTIEVGNIVEDYAPDQQSVKAIRRLSEYSTRDESFIKNNSSKFSKGILMMGKVGTGKTVLIKSLCALLKHFSFYKQNSNSAEKLRPTILPAYVFTESFYKNGYNMFDEGLRVNHKTITVLSELLFIDDIGSENIISNYGNTTNVIGELILRRYDRGVKTFATTNLSPENLKIFYGERVYSRMKEMMNFIEFEGNDRRK